jgi:type I restriction enzyme M protein
MFEQTFKNIDDILHKDAGCTSELDYTEQSSWLLFLKYLDALEADRAAEAELEGRAYSFILAQPFRWERWAAPKTADGRLDHHTALTGDDLRDFGRSWRRTGSSPRMWAASGTSRTWAPSCWLPA